MAKKRAGKKPLIKSPKKDDKDGPAVIELEKGDVALVIGEKDSTLFLPAHYEDDDPIPEHMQLMCAMAILFKNDLTFRRYIKKRWNEILRDLDEDPEFRKQQKRKPTRPHNKSLKRSKGAWIN